MEPMTPSPAPCRGRPVLAVTLVVVIALGLASRSPALPLLRVLGKYPGDALWSSMVFVGWALVLPMATTGRLAMMALATSIGIEVLKLWQVPWFVAVRQTTPGHLVFGHAFSWQNLVAYGVGVAAACIIDRLWMKAHRDPRGLL